MACIKKRMLWRDIAGTFRKSMGRFLSIVFLIALGSFALVGLRVTGPDMRAAGAAYFTEHDMADITVIGDLGIDRDDQADIEKASGIRQVEYGYLKDVTVKGTDDAVRVWSAPEHVSAYEVVDGRMPDAADEIALSESLAERYPNGSKIRVREKASTDGDALRRHTFTVVGHVNSMEIVSDVNRGQTQSGTGELAGYGVVSPKTFDVDYYMLARITYRDTRGLDPYSQTYLDRVSAHKKDLDKLLDEAPGRRLRTVRATYDEQIDDGQAKVDDAKRQLTDAKQSLDDAAGQLADGQAQIDDAQSQVNSGASQIADARSQIDANQRKLDDAAAQLASGRQSLADNWAVLSRAHAQLAESRQQLEEGKSQLDAASKTIAQKDAELAEAKTKLDAGAAEIAQKEGELAQAKTQLDDASARIAAKEQELSAAKQQVAAYDEGRAAVAAGRQQIAEKTAELDAAEQQLDSKQADAERARQALPALTQAEQKLAQGVMTTQGRLDQANTKVAELEEQLAASTDPAEQEQIQTQLVAAKAEQTAAQRGVTVATVLHDQAVAALKKAQDGVAAYDEGRAQVAAGRQEIAAKTQELDAAEAELDANRDAVEAARPKIAQGEQDLADAKREYAVKQAEYDTAAAQLAEAKEELASKQAEYEQGASALADAKREYAAKQTEYEAGVAAYDQGRASYEQGLAQWKDAQRQVNDGEASYAAGAAQLSQARGTLASKVSELDDARAQVASARETLAQKTAEYKDGLAEYNEQLPDAQREITDAESDLADARAARDELEAPAYAVDSRRETPGSEGYVTYDSVSEIVDSLADIFPYFMYLVAALVASTTMTRMVDEERINAGTLKALGYDDADVLKKFVAYGAAAGTLGAALGIVTGHTVIPLIVNNAYAHGFTLPPIHLGFYPVVSLAALVLALLVSVVPAVLAAKREIVEKPAQLLLPKPPAKGSQILLERIPFIWDRLSFTHKVTVRNLLRYKKRMLMTVLGVAGAAMVMFTGFAVQHSVDGIAEQQFGDKGIIGYDLIVAEESHVSGTERAAIEKQLDSSAVKSHASVRYEELSKAAGAKGDEQTINLVVAQDERTFSKYLHLRDRASGEALDLPDDGAIISERLATLTGTQVGDELTFKDADGTERKVRVAGICEMYMEHFMFMSPEAYEDTFGGEPETNAYVVTLKDGSLSGTRTEAANFMELDGVLGVVQSAGLIDQINVIVESLNQIMLVLIVASILLAAVIVYNLVSVNVAERIRELSTVKVLGFYDREVTMYIYRETIINSLVALPAGWLGGWLMQQYIIQAVPPENVMFDPAPGIVPFLVPIVVIGLVVTVMYFVVNRQLRDVDMLEALKSVD